jgi:hypothetical protein
MGETQDTHSRREFLGWLARGAALAGLTAVAAGVVLKRRTQGADAEDPCINDGLCGRCPRLARCRLPQASSARHLAT